MVVHYCWGVTEKGTVQESGDGALRVDPAGVGPNAQSALKETTFKPGAKGKWRNSLGEGAG